MRPLKERLEDIGYDVELERYVRMDLLDEANLFRLDERAESVERPHADVTKIYGALQKTGESIKAASGQTSKLKELSTERMRLRTSIREMTKFFTGIMEGVIKPGGENLSDFLCNRIRELSALD